MTKAKFVCAHCKREAFVFDDNGQPQVGFDVSNHILCKECIATASTTASGWDLSPSAIPTRYKRTPYSYLNCWNEKKADHRHYEVISKWLAQKPITKGWMLLGTVGRGKTCLAAAIARALNDEAHNGYVFTFATGSELAAAFGRIQQNSYKYSDELQAFNNKYLPRLGSERQVCILDDFTDIDYSSPLFPHLMQQLYDRDAIVLITANASIHQIEAQVGDIRINSRLMQMCNVHTFEGDDYRGNKVRG